MKTIGLLGGMSWESTLGYYRAINEGVNAALGGLHSAQMVLYSLDFDPIEKLQQEGDWKSTTKLLTTAAQRIQAAGADFLLICTNTMHKIAPDIEKAVQIPLLHIADATADVLIHDGVQKVGLLGTAYTMEHDFYKGRLKNHYGLDVIVPDPADRKSVHDIIFRELCRGRFEKDAKSTYLRIVADLAQAGAEAVILGCTEIGMLISQADTLVKLYDTTEIHAKKAVEYAL